MPIPDIKVREQPYEELADSEKAFETVAPAEWGQRTPPQTGEISTRRMDLARTIEDKERIPRDEAYKKAEETYTDRRAWSPIFEPVGAPDKPKPPPEDMDLLDKAAAGIENFYRMIRPVYGGEERSKDWEPDPKDVVKPSGESRPDSELGEQEGAPVQEVRVDKKGERRSKRTPVGEYATPPARYFPLLSLLDTQLNKKFGKKQMTQAKTEGLALAGELAVQGATLPFSILGLPIRFFEGAASGKPFEPLSDEEVEKRAKEYDKAPATSIFAMPDLEYEKEKGPYESKPLSAARWKELWDRQREYNKNHAVKTNIRARHFVAHHLTGEEKWEESKALKGLVRALMVEEGDVGELAYDFGDYLRGDETEGLLREQTETRILRVIGSGLIGLASESLYALPTSGLVRRTGMATNYGELMFGRWDESERGPALRGESLKRSAVMARNIRGDYSQFSPIGKVLMNAMEKTEHGHTFMTDLHALGKARVHMRPYEEYAQQDDWYRNVTETVVGFIPGEHLQRLRDYEQDVRVLDHRQELAAVLFGAAGFGLDFMPVERVLKVPFSAAARQRRASEILQAEANLYEKGILPVESNLADFLYHQDVDVAESNRFHFAHGILDGTIKAEDIPDAWRPIAEQILKDHGVDMTLDEAIRFASNPETRLDPRTEPVDVEVTVQKPKQSAKKYSTEEYEALLKVSADPELFAAELIRIHGRRPKSSTEALEWKSRAEATALRVPEETGYYLLRHRDPSTYPGHNGADTIHTLYDDAGNVVNSGSYADMLQQLLYTGQQYRRLAEDVAAKRAAGDVPEADIDALVAQLDQMGDVSLYTVKDGAPHESVRGTVLSWSRSGNRQDLTPLEGVMPSPSYRQVDPVTMKGVGDPVPRKSIDYRNRRAGALLKPPGRLMTSASGNVRAFFASPAEKIIVRAIREGDASILKKLDALPESAQILDKANRTQEWVDAMRRHGIYLFGDDANQIDKLLDGMGYEMYNHREGAVLVGGNLPWQGRVYVRRKVKSSPETNGAGDVRTEGPTIRAGSVDNKVPIRPKVLAQQVFQRLYAGNPPIKDMPILDAFQRTVVDVLVDAEKAYYRDKLGAHTVRPIPGGAYVTHREQRRVVSQVMDQYNEAGLDPAKIEVNKQGIIVLTDQEAVAFNELARRAGLDEIQLKKALGENWNHVSPKLWNQLQNMLMSKAAGRSAQKSYSMRQTSRTSDRIKHALARWVRGMTLRHTRPAADKKGQFWRAAKDFVATGGKKDWVPGVGSFFDVNRALLPDWVARVVDEAIRELSKNADTVGLWIQKHMVESTNGAPRKWNGEFNVNEALQDLMPTYTPVSAGEALLLSRIDALKEQFDELNKSSMDVIDQSHRKEIDDLIFATRDDLLEYAGDFRDIAPGLDFADAEAVLGELIVYQKVRHMQMDKDALRLLRSFVQQEHVAEQLNNIVLGVGVKPNTPDVIKWFIQNKRKLYADVISDGNFGSSLLQEFAEKFNTPLLDEGPAIMNFILDTRADGILNKHLRRLAREGVGVRAVKSGPSDVVGASRLENLVVKILNNEHKMVDSKGREHLLASHEDYRQAMVIVNRMGYADKDIKALETLGHWNVKSGIGKSARVEALKLVLTPEMTSMLMYAHRRGKFSLSSILQQGDAGAQAFNGLMRWHRMALTTLSPQYHASAMLSAMVTMHRQLGSRQVMGTLSQMFQNPEMVLEITRRTGKSRSQGKTLGARVFRTKDGRIFTADMLEEGIQKYGVDVTVARSELQRGILRDMQRSQDRVTLSTGKRVLLAGPDAIAWMADTTADFAHQVDMLYRNSTLLDRLNKGDSFVEAAKKARRSTFAYDTLTPFERKVMRSIFTWYSFARKDIGSMAKAFVDNPSRIAVEERLFRNIHTAITGDDEYELSSDPKAHARIQLPMGQVIDENGNVDRNFRTLLWGTTATGGREAVITFFNFLGVLDLMTAGALEEPTRGLISKKRFFAEMGPVKSIIHAMSNVNPATGYDASSWRDYRVHEMYLPLLLPLGLAEPHMLGGADNMDWANTSLHGKSATWVIPQDNSSSSTFARRIYALWTQALGMDRVEDTFLAPLHRMLSAYMGTTDEVRFTDKDGKVRLGAPGWQAILNMIAPTTKRLTQEESVRRQTKQRASALDHKIEEQ